MNPIKAKTTPLLQHCLPILFVVAAAFSAMFWSGRANALERNFAGSAQFDYMFVKIPGVAIPRTSTFDGFTSEFALKMAIDVSDNLSASVKVCYGCHGFEVPMAHLDYRVSDELNFRIGRFSPSLGAFNLRHDPANHKLSTKPLMYDMGRMVRLREWNLGVVPSPFPDNGIEASGTHWFGEKIQLDYALYAVAGFKADTSAMDLDWQESRSGNLYYVDNNSRPAYGGRIALTAKLSASSDVTIGMSGQRGAFDPESKQTYLFFGGDLSFRIKRTNLRFEYLARRQTFDATDPARFKYDLPETGGDFFVKHGAYVELEQPISKSVDIIARIDGMMRVGNVLKDSPLSKKAVIARGTIGTMIALERNLRLKASAEVWTWNDTYEADGKKLGLGLHLAAIGTY